MKERKPDAKVVRREIEQIVGRAFNAIRKKYRSHYDDIYLLSAFAHIAQRLVLRKVIEVAKKKGEKK